MTTSLDYRAALKRLEQENRSLARRVQVLEGQVQAIFASTNALDPAKEVGKSEA